MYFGIRQTQFRIVACDFLIVPTDDITGKDPLVRCSRQSQLFDRDATRVLQVVRQDDGTGRHRQLPYPPVDLQDLFLCQRFVTRTKIDKFIHELLDASAAADRLVGDRVIRTLLGEIAKPTFIQRCGKRRSCRLQLNGVGRRRLSVASAQQTP